MNDARQRLVRLIHVARRELGLDEDTYRALLDGCVQKNSTTAMSVPELERVTARMKQLGFRVRRNARTLALDAQSRKIRALWLELHRAGAVRVSDEAALAAYVQRQTGVAALQWLDPVQASGVIEALKQWLARSAGKRA